MKSELRFRHIALALALTAFSVAAVAHADSSDAPHVGFWGRVKAVFTGKHKPKTTSSSPAPATAETQQPAPPPPPQTKLLRYDVSLGDSDDCSQLAAKLSSALTNAMSSNQVTLSDAVKATCTERKETYEKGTYRQGTIEITYDYTSQGYWTSRAPALNQDIIGQPLMLEQADGSFGIYPTYQTCVDAAAQVLPGYGKATGADALAYYCKQAGYGYTQLSDAQLADLPGTLKKGPVGNYSLVIYSSGKQTARVWMYQNAAGRIGMMSDAIAETSVVSSQLTAAGVTIAYPNDPTLSDSTHIAYYGSQAANIETGTAGRTASLKECTDQTAKAEQIWTALGAQNPKAICEQQYGDEQTLNVISVGGSYVMDSAGYGDLTYSSYDECMNADEQALVEKADANSYTQGVLCFPDQNIKGQYRAQFYHK